jgi:hypothetical protein
MANKERPRPPKAPSPDIVYRMTVTVSLTIEQANALAQGAFACTSSFDPKQLNSATTALQEVQAAITRAGYGPKPIV